MYQIKFSFEAAGHAPVVVSGIAGGQTLLEVALKHSVSLPHDCGGICSCTTCHVWVVKGAQCLNEQELREQHFIQRKVRGATAASRLSCQSVLLEGRGELEIIIPIAGKRV